MRRGHLLTVKLFLTVGVVALIYWSLSRPDAGILKELSVAGPIGATIIVTAFLLCVFLYCRDLERLLAAIPEHHRAASPKSVWWMFALPYNFIEDFFIVWNIGTSLKATSKENQNLAAVVGHCGFFSGLGWCGLQILSLVPNSIGALGGVLAIPLWIWHWAYVRRMRARLT